MCGKHSKEDDERVHIGLYATLGLKLPAHSKAYPETGFCVSNDGKREYLAIAKGGPGGKVMLCWVNETGISNCEDYERGLSPLGSVFCFTSRGKKERVNMISALTSQSEMRYMLYEDSMNQRRLITFMSYLIRTSK